MMKEITTVPFIAPTTIDEVIFQLEQLVDECIKTNDRLGYFSSLYHKVTVKVSEGIKNNEFEDGSRMEKLDVIFANRFLYAVYQWKNKQLASPPWMTTFEATKKRSALVLQHLLLAINAHINFDLAIATVETVGEKDIRLIRKDFASINNILGSLVFEVINELNHISPLLSLFGMHAGNDSILIQFSITNARDGAWIFAEDLHLNAQQGYDKCIGDRAVAISKLGSALVNTKGLLRFTRWIIHLFEWKKPHKIITALYKRENKYITTDSSQQPAPE